MLDDGSGPLAFDSSGNENHGTVNGATWTDGLLGGALYFDGMDDHVDLGPLDPPPDDRSGFTISAWFKAESFDSSHRDNRIISKTTGPSNDDHYWMLSTFENEDQTVLRFRLKTDGETDLLLADQGDIQTGEWVHTVGTYDGSAMRLYMDSDEVGVLPKSGEVSANGSVMAMIGMNSDGSDPWHGILDDVRIYHRGLTPLEVDSLYRAGTDSSSGPEPPLDPPLFTEVRIVSPIGADRIRYYLPDPSDVLIRLYDVNGRRLLSRDLGRRPSGWNTYLHHGTGDNGRRLPGGLYFIHLSALGTETTAKLILLRD
jgi:hypothetical protein